MSKVLSHSTQESSEADEVKRVLLVPEPGYRAERTDWEVVQNAVACLSRCVGELRQLHALLDSDYTELDQHVVAQLITSVAVLRERTCGVARDLGFRGEL